MAYYDMFLGSAISPPDRWKNRYQALINKKFINASTYYTDVEEEIEFGTLEFEPIVCRVNSLVDAKTGQRVNDDYKKIIFPDNNHEPSIGTRYRFDGNIWIAYSSDNIKTDTASVYVRRCNNTMNFQDVYGNIHREPCYIDYTVTETQLFREYSMEVASGRILVQCQKNDWTRDINVNDRFIFGDDVYKIRNRNRFDRRYTFDDDTNYFVSYYADLNEKAESDNFELGIADYKCYSYYISSPESITNIVGFSGLLNYSVYLNDQIIEEDLYWTSTNEDVATIDNSGNFVMRSAGTCQFIGRMVNREDVITTVDVIVLTQSADIYSYAVEPEIYIIRLNSTTRYSVFEYKNGIIQPTKFNIICSRLSLNNYTFISDGNVKILDGTIYATDVNNFSITNLRTNRDIQLLVTIVNPNTGLVVKSFDIQMGGV